ncbi:uncharacterized protein [Leptinotarsa decemlineata]|uniref:uncharacterized protein n=1 Tax=Leptinotarsa decemlineata TaxID=7539 RepID=UPI003D309D4A
MDFDGDVTSRESDPFADSGSEYLPSDGDLEETNRDGEQDDDTEADIDSAEPTTSSHSKPKKRVRNPENWKRTINKRKKCAGQEYVTKSSKTVRSKSFKPFECKCKGRCSFLLPAERQMELHNNFYTLESFDLQTAYLFGLIKVVNKLRCYTLNPESKREHTRLYFLPRQDGVEHKVCKPFFQAVFQVSAGRLDRLLKHKSLGTPPPCDKRGKHPPHNKTSDVKKMELKDFIEKFPWYESHYGREKSNHRKYLSPDLSLGKMYQLYKDETQDPLSYFIFRDTFNKEYNLHFHPPITDSCKKCDLFEVKIKAADTESRGKLETERELHQKKAKSARDSLKRDTEMAKNGSASVICFDLMKTLPTPVLTAGICYYKRQLWTYCFNIHEMGTNNSFMFVWDETVASRGPQEVGSCILFYIKNYIKSKRLIMYSDQCGGQNRNIKMSLLCNYITASRNFTVEEIDHKFLVSGHSYLPSDQDFGLIEKEKKFHPHVFIPQDWHTVIKHARKKHPFIVINMDKSNFFSTKFLESTITNRKVSESKTKVEWLKIQWLRFRKDFPNTLQYKYSNHEDVYFETVDLKKRKSVSKNTMELPLLYPNGNTINEAKKRDLLQLMELIPPIHHEFYKNLRSSAQAAGGEIIGPFDVEEN